MEVNEGGIPGMSKSEEKRNVGVLKQKYFEVDRAFIYFIWDYFTGSIILIGRVTRPIIWKPKVSEHPKSVIPLIFLNIEKYINKQWLIKQNLYEIL